MESQAVPAKVARSFNDPHPEHVAETAFEVWALLADRSVPRTMQLLPDYLEAHLIPPERTIRHWATKWDARADERIRALAPALADRALARGFALLPVAMERIAEALSGELRQTVEPRQLAQIYKLEAAYVEHLTTMLGLGNLGERKPASLPQPDQAAAVSEMTADEASRMLANLLRAGDTLKR